MRREGGRRLSRQPSPSSMMRRAVRSSIVSLPKYQDFELFGVIHAALPANLARDWPQYSHGVLLGIEVRSLCAACDAKTGNIKAFAPALHGFRDTLRRDARMNFHRTSPSCREPGSRCSARSGGLALIAPARFPPPVLETAKRRRG